jgi:hypothetical protein
VHYPNQYPLDTAFMFNHGFVDTLEVHLQLMAFPVLDLVNEDCSCITPALYGLWLR